MRQHQYFVSILCLISLAIFSNCKKEESIKEIPGIQDFRISKDTLIQSIIPTRDEFLLEFTFINEKGKSGFLNDTDTIIMAYCDERINLKYPSVLISPTPPNPKIVAINDGNISVRIPTTCCIYTDGRSPCEHEPNIYQTVAYKFTFETNFGQILPDQNISFILNCE